MTFQPWIIEFGDALLAHLADAGQPLYLVQSRLRAGLSVDTLVRETGAVVPLDHSLSGDLTAYLRSRVPDQDLSHAG